NVTMRIALMGRHERMDAQRAYQLGLVSEVVPHEQLMARAREIADTVNRNAPLAVRGTRLAIRKGLGLPLYEAELLAESSRRRCWGAPIATRAGVTIRGKSGRFCGGAAGSSRTGVPRRGAWG